MVSSVSTISFQLLKKYNELCKEFPQIRTPNPSQGTLSLYLNEDDCRSDLMQINKMRQYHNLVPAVSYLGPQAGENIKSQHLPSLNLQYANKIKGGILTVEDTSGDTRKVTETLYQKCVDKGVKFHFDETVTEIVKDENKITCVLTSKGNTYFADDYVLTTGVHVDVTHQIGIRLPIYPIKGFSIDIPIKPFVSPIHIPNVALTESKGKLYVSRVGNSIRMSGFAELDGFDKTLNFKKKTNIYKLHQPGNGH